MRATNILGWRGRGGSSHLGLGERLTQPLDLSTCSSEGLVAVTQGLVAGLDGGIPHMHRADPLCNLAVHGWRGWHFADLAGSTPGGPLEMALGES